MKLRSIYLATTTSCCVALFAASSWAVPTECVSVGVGTPTLKLAIAANFFEPAKAVALDFIQASGGSVTAVWVCQNSTAHLNAEIRNGTELPAPLLPDPGFPRYDYFFAANTSTPQGLESLVPGNKTFLYAKGIPVLYSDTDLNPGVATAGDLITGLGTSTHATVAGTSLSGMQINARAGNVGVADPTAAPYGLAAKNVTTAMGYAWTGNTPPPPMLPTPFANIDVTYQAVGTGSGPSFVGAAFVSKSQICPSLSKPVQYVEFTGFLLDQSAIKLSSTLSANSFDTYLRGRLATDWNSFLVESCYFAISVPAVPIGSFAAPIIGAGLFLLGVLQLQRRKPRQLGLAAE